MKVNAMDVICYSCCYWFYNAFDATQVTWTWSMVTDVTASEKHYDIRDELSQ